MSELMVEVKRITDILEHPNADRMELAMVDGYQVCVQKGIHKPGDLVVYIPVDSILNDRLESMIFGPDAKVKLSKHRVRAIKLRGAVSQGMIIPLDLAAQYPGASAVKSVAKEGLDCTKALDITKYEPPVNAMPQSMKATAKRHCHPDFKKYTGINHLRKYWDAFVEGTMVWYTEKVHGTNFRAGWVKNKPRTIFQKIKRLMRISPEWEFVYGSHNVQLQDGKGKHAFADNVYARVVRVEKLKDKIPKGQVWYGEIVGPDIQKGYGYSVPEGTYRVLFFDIMEDGRYLSFGDAVAYFVECGAKPVPYSLEVFNKDKLLQLLNHPDAVSAVDNKTKPIEGFVVRPVHEESFWGGRKILKILSDEYLLRKDNTDWH